MERQPAAHITEKGRTDSIRFAEMLLAVKKSKQIPAPICNATALKSMVTTVLKPAMAILFVNLPCMFFKIISPLINFCS